MENKNSHVFDNLIKEINSYSKDVLKNLAIQAREELTQETANAIQTFYDDYQPIYYKRHFYNFKKKSFRKYYKNSHNSRYSGGVELTPEQMDNIYQDNVEEVFDMVYAGFHGVASGFYSPNSFNVIPNVTKPSPIQRIYDKRDYIENHIDKYCKNAQIIAKKNNHYTYF